MYQYFAAWLTSESIGSAMKSPNMISKTGRSPVTAAPNAAPASASSEIGVSITRSAPKRSSSPGVGLEHAAGQRRRPRRRRSRARRARAPRRSRRGSRVRNSSVPCSWRELRRARPRPGRGRARPARSRPRRRCARAISCSTAAISCSATPSASSRSRRARQRVALQPVLDLLLRAVRRRVGLRVAVVAVGRHSSSVGPPPARARSTASRAASGTAHRSLPSTTGGGHPVRRRARRRCRRRRSPAAIGVNSP